MPRHIPQGLGCSGAAAPNARAAGARGRQGREAGRRAKVASQGGEPGGEMDELGTILGVWAHPDDECYLSAGIMARAVRNGSRVVCVTATRGEGGSMDEEKWPPEKMADVRTKELERSLEILGVREHIWLDMKDVDMETGLPDEGFGRVRELVGDIQPDTILTFGPDGMTDHAAHKDV